jgi:hypothetical protein
LAKNDPVVVNEGATYEAKNEDSQGEKRRVVAYHVDRPRSTVFVAPLGSSSEERIAIDDFLRDYELVAQQGEPLPEDRDQKATNTRTADRNVRTPQLDTTRASPTREELESRNAKRNER